MAATKSLSIRVDAELKKQAEEVLSELGISLSTAVTMLLRTIVRNRAVPPELFTLEEPSKREAKEENLGEI